MKKEDYSRRFREEIDIYKEKNQVHDLPPIFHYYTEKYLRPVLNKNGYLDLLDFFVQNIISTSKRNNNTNIVSYGAGNGEVEVIIARRLKDVSFESFHFTCVDINEDMLSRAHEVTAQVGLKPHFDFICGNVTNSTAGRIFDIHLAHQVLHHIVDLEGLFDTVHESMHNDSIFLISDIIGRNGHMRWPETLVIVEKLWQTLQDRHKYNNQLGYNEEKFVNFDCSEEGFEGIRSQDILPLLNETFDIEEFIAWGGVVDIFIDRSFGPNFKTDNDEDTGFIDYVQGIEKRYLESGVIKPTQAIARLRRKNTSSRKIDVSRFQRIDDLIILPDTESISYTFSRRCQTVKHIYTDDLVSGFYPTEGKKSWRWTDFEFRYNLYTPESNRPYSCRLIIDYWNPPTRKETGACVYINSIFVGRIEKIFACEEKLIRLDFESFGGKLEIRVILDEPFKSPDNEDRRRLGIIVRELGIQVPDEVRCSPLIGQESGNITV